MLSALLMSQYGQLTDLADIWRANGALSFEVWNNDTLLARWPEEEVQVSGVIRAQIEIRGQTYGELRVLGLTDQVSRKRLLLDAQFLASMIGLEQELETMTAELIDCQDHLLALYNLNQSTRSHLELDEMLRSLTCEAARLVKAQASFIVLSASVGFPTLVQYPTPLLDEHVAEQFFHNIQASGREVLINALDTRMDVLPELPPQITSLFFVPIQIRGVIIAGGLGLVNKSGIGFTSPDLKLARAIAEQIGAQIEKTLLYEESIAQAYMRAEMQLARKVQLQLLPQRLPVIAELDIFAQTRPAMQVGGDFYDLIFHPGQPFTFMLGDVSGKGVSAALLMTTTLTTMRSKATLMPRPTPAAIISRTNADLYHDFTDVGMFATAFIGQYELQQRQLIYANAGHAPVIYFPHCGQARILEADGPPIGVLPASICGQQTIAFGSGDLLVVATDGFSEARNLAGELFGHERMIYLTRREVHKTAAEIAASLYTAIEHFSYKRPQDDDQTLIVIKGR